MAGPPAEIVSRLAVRGAQNLYVDGGITIQGFLRAGLIQRLIITRVPVLIGEGVPLFGSLPRDIRLRLGTIRAGWFRVNTMLPPDNRLDLPAPGRSAAVWSRCSRASAQPGVGP